MGSKKIVGVLQCAKPHFKRLIKEWNKLFLSFIFSTFPKYKFDHYKCKKCLYKQEDTRLEVWPFYVTFLINTESQKC